MIKVFMKQRQIETGSPLALFSALGISASSIQLEFAGFDPSDCEHIVMNYDVDWDSDLIAYRNQG